MIEMKVMDINSIKNETEKNRIDDMVDVIIVGSGLAGLFTALRIQDDLKVLILTKETYQQSNSYLAQGGIACVVDLKNDTHQLHIEDTMKCGHFVNNKEAVQTLITEGLANVQLLEELGVEFDLTAEGTYDLGMEGAHSRKRILHCEDHTGLSIMEALHAQIMRKSNVTVVEHVLVTNILLDKGLCVGVQALVESQDANGEIQRVEKSFYSKTTVLATGGIGKVFGNTTNNHTITGDGIGMAMRAQVQLRDMNKIQFHPTVFYSDQQGEHFLVSEAVRGEGALLYNEKKERFMHKYHELGELAPRDVVSQAIFKELKHQSKPYVYLDARELEGHEFSKRFPTIHNHCMENGIDGSENLIPVAPMMHYFMGGIAIDLKGKTNVPWLYACGECANTGVHGNNRLASNSLLEAIVFANRIAQSINMRVPNQGTGHIAKIATVPNNHCLSTFQAEVLGEVVQHKIYGIASEQIAPFYRELENLFLNKPSLNDMIQLKEQIKKMTLIQDTQDVVQIENFHKYLVMTQVIHQMIQEKILEELKYVAESSH